MRTKVGTSGDVLLLPLEGVGVTPALRTTNRLHSYVANARLSLLKRD